jgi:hypothetical protein
MLTFKSFLLYERFINLIHNDPKKHEYADEVKGLLDKSYASLGGIHGSGFKDKEDMIKNIPMWKLKKHQGKIVAATMYKDKGGRKAVAVATDGSEHGKRGASQIMTDDLKTGRSYGEKSSKSLSFVKKHVGSEELKKHVIPYHEVHKHVDKNDEIRRPPSDDEELTRHPEYKDHFYQRKIGGQWHTKLMLGKPGQTITAKK